MKHEHVLERRSLHRKQSAAARAHTKPGLCKTGQSKAAFRSEVPGEGVCCKKRVANLHGTSNKTKPVRSKSTFVDNPPARS